MSDDKNLLPTCLSRTVIYECPWVNVYRDRVRLANGHIVEQYHYLDFGLGAVTAVVENDEGQILMNYMARYHSGKVSWELPAGGIDVGETPIEAARREVWEETGYETYDHRLLSSYEPINGISNLTNHLVYCRAGKGSGRRDENEVQAVSWFSPEGLWEMVRRQEIQDGFTVTGLLMYRLMGERNL